MREGAAVFSKEKLPGRDYTNSLLLAEWLVPDFPRAARGASKLQWLGGPHEPLSEVR
jgi:hypothetical protein